MAQYGTGSYGTMGPWSPTKHDTECLVFVGMPKGVSDVAKGLNLEPLSATYLQRGNLSEDVMTHWRDTMVDRPETDGAIYVTGWTISGLAVLVAVVAVWAFGI